MLGNGLHTFVNRVILILGRLGWVLSLSWSYWVRLRPYVLCNGPHVLGNGPYVLGNGPYVLGNGPYVLGNGPQVLGNGPLVLGNGPHVLGIMSQFGIM